MPVIPQAVGYVSRALGIVVLLWAALALARCRAADDTAPLTDSRQGALLPIGQEIGPLSAPGARDVRVAYGGGVYLVSWLDGNRLKASRLAPSGAVLAPVIEIALDVSPPTYDLAFDGDSFVLVFNPDGKLDGARIRSDGTIPDSPPVTLIANGDFQNAAAWLAALSCAPNGDCLVMYHYPEEVETCPCFIGTPAGSMRILAADGIRPNSAAPQWAWRTTGIGGGLASFPQGSRSCACVQPGTYLALSGRLAWDGNAFHAAWEESNPDNPMDGYRDGDIRERLFGGPSSTPGSGTNHQTQAAIACAAPGKCLTVWHENRTWRDPPRQVPTEGWVRTSSGISIPAEAGWARPEIVFNSGSGEYLVLYWDNAVMGVRVSASGQLISGAPFLVQPADLGRLGAGPDGVSLLAYIRGGSVYARALRPAAAACAKDSECATGFCRDGACCNTDCGGGSATDCQACSILAGAPSDGTCAPARVRTICRMPAGECDDVERCDGVSTACPTDQLSIAGTVCRPPSDLCDPPEVCTGTTVTCPVDGWRTTCPVEREDCLALSCPYCDAPRERFFGTSSFGETCRSAKGPCDVKEVCPGVPSQRCPADEHEPDGTPCSDGPCRTGSCQAGKCVSIPISGGSCDDADLCTGEDSCVTGACQGRPLTGTPCNDGNRCTHSDVCSAGKCTGTPLSCGSSSGPCATATCIPETGVCVSTSKPDGSACPAGTCVAGSCQLTTDGSAGDGASDGPARDAASDVGASADALPGDAAPRKDAAIPDAMPNEASSQPDATGTGGKVGAPGDDIGCDGGCSVPARGSAAWPSVLLVLAFMRRRRQTSRNVAYRRFSAVSRPSRRKSSRFRPTPQA